MGRVFIRKIMSKKTVDFKKIYVTKSNYSYPHLILFLDCFSIFKAMKFFWAKNKKKTLFQI